MKSLNETQSFKTLSLTLPSNKNKEWLNNFPILSIFFAIPALIPFLFPSFTNLMQYDRLGIACGETWRIISCHWTHWSWEHLIWDVVVFVALGAVCERFNRRNFFLCIIFTSLLIPIGVWLLLPEMHYYRGLSGFDAALFIMAAFVMVDDKTLGKSRNSVLIKIAAITCLLAKISYEAIFQQAIFVQSGNDFIPVPLAHLVGGIVGVVLGWRHGKIPKSYDVQRPFHITI